MGFYLRHPSWMPHRDTEQTSAYGIPKHTRPGDISTLVNGFKMEAHVFYCTS
jgi:hypothetical protein